MRSIMGLFFMTVLAVPAAVYQIGEMNAFELHSQVVETPVKVITIDAGESTEVNIAEKKSPQMSIEKTNDRQALEDEKQMIRVGLMAKGREPEQLGDLKSLLMTPLQKINEMPLEKWMEIKGIGKVTAERILSFRNSQGGFEVLDELLEVKGIGPAKYAAIMEWLGQQNE